MFTIFGNDGQTYGPVSLDTIRQWRLGGRVNGDTRVRPEGTEAWMTLRQLPELAADFNAPPPLPSAAPVAVAAVPESGLNTLIPYRNGMALAAYYCGVFALIPLLGAVLGWVALGLGVAGLRAAKKNPVMGGKVHAWVGIVLGALCALGNVLLIAVPFFMATRR
jgi:hypothetical protein